MQPLLGSLLGSAIPTPVVPIPWKHAMQGGAAWGAQFDGEESLWCSACRAYSVPEVSAKGSTPGMDPVDNIWALIPTKQGKASCCQAVFKAETVCCILSKRPAPAQPLGVLFKVAEEDGHQKQVEAACLWVTGAGALPLSAKVSCVLDIVGRVRGEGEKVRAGCVGLRSVLLGAHPCFVLLGAHLCFVLLGAHPCFVLLGAHP